jgi:UDP-N-acetylglucosamine:LPS N-acetylglucosamine transferase
MQHAMRKAINVLRKEKPDVVVAEFNYQSNFRDRTSTLESLLATIERLQQTHTKTIKVIVFYEQEYEHQLQKLRNMFSNFDAIAYPVKEDVLKQHLA